MKKIRVNRRYSVFKILNSVLSVSSVIKKFPLLNLCHPCNSRILILSPGERIENKNSLLTVVIAESMNQ